MYKAANIIHSYSL